MPSFRSILATDILDHSLHLCPVILLLQPSTSILIPWVNQGLLHICRQLPPFAGFLSKVDDQGRNT